MTTAAAPPISNRRNALLWPLWIAAAFTLLAVIGISYASAHWPYRYRNVGPLLKNLLASQISIGRYERTYFPSPGFIVTGLTLRRNSAPDLPPVGSARTLIVEGRWSDLLLLRRRVRLVDVEGLHIVIPPVGSRANREDFPAGSSADFSGPETVVEQFNIHNAVLDILRTGGGRYSFPIRQLVIRNLHKGQTITYMLDMQNARPSGRIHASGVFGPLLPKNLGATQLSGSFTFSDGRLSDIHGLNGEFTAQGSFHGALSAIEADAACHSTDFAVGHGRPTAIDVFGHATVNGLNGNMILHTIDTHTGQTNLRAQGSILGSPKLTNLDLTITRGRAEDVLRPFFDEDVPIAGALWLQSHATLAPAQHGLTFFDRLAMQGTFNIPAGRLTDHSLEEKLSAFSERARGVKGNKDPDHGKHPEVLSSLRARAAIRNGVVSTHGMLFAIPGASAGLNGTFNLQNRNVHLLGNLDMQTDLSHVTTGFKSLLIKPLSPFFKKKNAGAVVPIAVTGAPRQYKITQNLFHQK
ncbi:MAG TPA: AsmA-like C-terminal region-containing protein [Acidobacteriaceae bacterium]|nr:AsmA-like C-terminal region-containing protein [Acidobacteriaceae bacterium]